MEIKEIVSHPLVTVEKESATHAKSAKTRPPNPKTRKKELSRKKKNVQTSYNF